MYPIYKVSVTHAYGLMCVRFDGPNTGERMYVEKGSLARTETNFLPHDHAHWRNPATFEEWLSFLPSPYREQAIENYQQRPNSRKPPSWVSSPLSALFEAFTWRGTKQGDSFWRDIYAGKNKMNAKTIVYYAKNSRSLASLVEEICEDKINEELPEEFACEEKEFGDSQFVGIENNLVYYFDQDCIEDCKDTHTFTLISRAALVQKLEALPDYVRPIDFIWNGYECRVYKDRATVGCQDISEDDIKAVEEIINNEVKQEPKTVKVKGGEEIVFRQQMTIEFDGNEGTPEEFRELINKIREVRKK